MKSLLRIGCVLVGVWTFSANPVAAQWGGVLDKLQKLSGPEFSSHGTIYRFGYQPGQRLDQERTRLLSTRVRAELALQTVSLLLGRTDTVIRPPIILRRSVEGVDTLPGDTLLTSFNRALLLRADSLIDAQRVCVDQANEIAQQMDNALAFKEAGIDTFRIGIEQTHEALESAIRVRAEDFTAWVQQLPVLERTTCRLRQQLRAASALPVDPGQGLVLRLGAFLRHDRDNEDREDQDIRAFSLQTTLEWRFGVQAWQKRFDFGIESGIAGHYYFGDFDSFVSFSFPLLVNYHPFARCSSWILRNFRVGGGVQVFAPIDVDAFEPILTLEERRVEVIPAFLLSIDISRSSLKGAPTLEC